MSKKKLSQPLDAERFKRLMPRSSDLTLIVLKGHLIMEEQLQWIIEDTLRQPEILQDARLEAQQKIVLAQAFFAGGPDELMWKNISRLNSLRNKFAHTLEPDGLEQSIDALIKENIDPAEKFKRCKDNKERARLLKNIFAFVCGQLRAGREVWQIVRNEKEEQWSNKYRSKEK